MTPVVRRRAPRAVGLLAMVLCGAQARSANAGTFLIYEQGAAALAQGGAFVARADDPSAIFYNAAGLALAPRLSAMIGATAIVSSTSARLQAPLVSADSQTQVRTPPTLYLTVPVGKRVAAGLGVFTPYGLSMKWPATWSGRYHIESAEARSATVNPTMAVRLRPGLAIGAGVSFTRAVFELHRAVNLVQADGQADLAGTSSSWGANAGILWEALPDKLRVGLSWRSPSGMHVVGAADFTVPPEWQDTLHDQKVEATVGTPDIFALGGALHLGPTWLSLDLVYTTWSRFKDLTFRFYDQAADGSKTYHDDLTTTEPARWSDVVGVHLGAETALGGGFLVRGGLAIEPSPVPASTLTPLIPDADQLRLSVGGAYDRGPLRVEASYMLAILAGRDSQLPGFPGHYDSLGHLFGLALQYRR